MTRLTKLTSLAAASFAVLTLAGCGGGGGGSSSGRGSNTPTSLYLTGTVENSSGAGLSGYKVEETGLAISTTSTSNGTFSLTLPASTSGATVTLDVFNSSDQLQLVQQVVISAVAGATQSVGTLSIGPPPPPSSPGNKSSH